MLNLGKTKRAIAMTAATLAVAAGATVAAAGSASATIGCTGGDGCSHQTTIMFDNGSYYGTSEWWGPNTVLKMQTDGNFVLYCTANGKPIWATGTNFVSDGFITRYLQFQYNGNMTIWNDDSLSYPHVTPVWNTNTPTAHEAIVQADGNFVIYDSSGNALWSSNTYHPNNCSATWGYWG
ncbi:hypothetical protein [Streptacidiphilus anmyonensis]|uniref:hypothetical protein n=1 Tax=Streptacidiphilus anmyonensis TaxID=405782 RepID=UPI0005A6B081|nr:hypothetical protein [Streptacidiphilus anmyonensis]